MNVMTNVARRGDGETGRQGDRETRRQGERGKQVPPARARQRATRTWGTWRRVSLSPCLLVSLSPCLFLLAGCIGSPANPAATQPATKVDPQSAQASYWFGKPAVTAVQAGDFETLWAAARRALRDRGFKADRLDYRQGVITSLPLVSKQAFEPWRSDATTAHDVAQSTLATVRRTVRFDIAKRPDGSFELTPKVVVERYSFIEHRITAVTQYREVYQLTKEEAYHRQDLRDNPTQEASPTPPPDYWYAIGRDETLERRLADDVRDRLKDLSPKASRARAEPVAAAPGSTAE